MCFGGDWGCIWKLYVECAFGQGPDGCLDVISVGDGTIGSLVTVRNKYFDMSTAAANGPGSVAGNTYTFINPVRILNEIDPGARYQSGCSYLSAARPTVGGDAPHAAPLVGGSHGVNNYTRESLPPAPGEPPRSVTACFDLGALHAPHPAANGTAHRIRHLNLPNMDGRRDCV